MATRTFDELSAKVLAILTEWDVMGLIGLGCPVDEYSVEAEAIVGSRYRINSLVTCIEVIREILRHYFGLALHEEDLELVAMFPYAKRILAVFEEHERWVVGNAVMSPTELEV